MRMHLKESGTTDIYALQLQADTLAEQNRRDAHDEYWRDDHALAHNLSQLRNVRIEGEDDGQRPHRYHLPVTYYRAHKRARHTLLGVIYRRRAKQRRADERLALLETPASPSPHTGKSLSFEKLYAEDMEMACIELKLLEMDREADLELADEMRWYHRDLYPERYWRHSLVLKRTWEQPRRRYRAEEALTDTF